MATTSPTLLERVRDPADREAWERFFSLYAPLLEGYAAARGLPPADAAEVRDQCLAIVARRMPAFRYDREAGGFQRWLHRIVRDRLVDHWRRRAPARAATEVLGRLADRGPAPDELWARHWRAEHLRFALERVRAAAHGPTFEAFELFVLQERPVAEVVARTGLTANQVYKAKARVLRRVRAVLRGLGIGDEPELA